MAVRSASSIISTARSPASITNSRSSPIAVRVTSSRYEQTSTCAVRSGTEAGSCRKTHCRAPVARRARDTRRCERAPQSAADDVEPRHVLRRPSTREDDRRRCAVLLEHAVDVGRTGSTYSTGTASSVATNRMSMSSRRTRLSCATCPKASPTVALVIVRSPSAPNDLDARVDAASVRASVPSPPRRRRRSRALDLTLRAANRRARH